MLRLTLLSAQYYAVAAQFSHKAPRPSSPVPENAAETSCSQFYQNCCFNFVNVVITRAVAINFDHNGSVVIAGACASSAGVGTYGFSHHEETLRKEPISLAQQYSFTRGFCRVTRYWIQEQ